MWWQLHVFRICSHLLYKTSKSVVKPDCYRQLLPEQIGQHTTTSVWAYYKQLHVNRISNDQGAKTSAQRVQQTPGSARDTPGTSPVVFSVNTLDCFTWSNHYMLISFSYMLVSRWRILAFSIWASDSTQQKRLESISQLWNPLSRSTNLVMGLSPLHGWHGHSPQKSQRVFCVCGFAVAEHCGLQELGFTNRFEGPGTLKGPGGL